MLTLIKHSIRRRYLEKNIHLVYALLLEQRDLQKVYCCKFDIFEFNYNNYFDLVYSYYSRNCHIFIVASLGDVSPIIALIKKGNDIIHASGDDKSAEQNLEVLKTHISELKSYHSPDGVSDTDSVASDASDLGNLTFTYEEEADP